MVYVAMVEFVGEAGPGRPASRRVRLRVGETPTEAALAAAASIHANDQLEHSAIAPGDGETWPVPEHELYLHYVPFAARVLLALLERDQPTFADLAMAVMSPPGRDFVRRHFEAETVSALVADRTLDQDLVAQLLASPVFDRLLTETLERFVLRRARTGRRDQ